MKKRPKREDTPYHPFRKIRVMFNGFQYAVITDFSVAYKLVVSIAVLIFAYRLRSWVDFLLIMVATGMMLMAEVFNTVIEELCDFIEPGYSERIKVIKDTAAAAAGIAIFVWIFTLGYQIWGLVELLL
ncbi:diacylglycerol kinase [Desulfovibrio inopinatus]|uniref:diacylglycerol kinase n=1 Tax=Desulfovibrio inopinatus TaxID=102109 RepID=UPI000416773D|nr:diacylglycerol kinase [Desulfovibrio inopinatus]